MTVNILLPGGMVDTDGTRPSTPERPTLSVDIMNKALLWLASPASDGRTGQRFVGRNWRPDLPAAQAADGAMEPLFCDRRRPAGERFQRRRLNN